MKFLLSVFITLCALIALPGQKVAMGHTQPVTPLDIRGVASVPTIPGAISTGVLRIGISAIEGMDIGKIGFPPYAGWIQVGTGSLPDPLSLQPLGGNVGIGTTTPTAILEVAGDVRVNGRISNVTDPVSAQDAATKAYVDLLEAQLMELQGIKDVENNQYDIVSIGTQVWMTENLRVTRYNDGTPIPLVTDNTAWGNLTSPAYTWYNNSASDYGALYNYYVVADTNSHNVCPAGWHVPTDAEWTILNDMLGGLNVAGGKMKETGLEHWLSPNAGAYNDSGFAGLPGGTRHPLGGSNSLGDSGIYWSSTELNTVYAWYRSLFYISSALYRGSDDKRYGFSVRCLKD